MREEKVKINLEVGLHTDLQQYLFKSSKFLSDIYLELGGKVDGKSIMRLGAAQDKSKINYKSEDEEEAMLN